MARMQRLWLRRKAARAMAEVAPGAQPTVERAAASTGAPLSAPMRRRVERLTGANLSGVRVHEGGASQQASNAVGALAYTQGNDIHFAAGQYRPGTVDGDRLIAHELAHVVQQQGGRDAAPQQKSATALSQPGDPAEVEADRLADAAVAGGADGNTDSNADSNRRAMALSAAPPTIARKETREPRDPRQFPTYEEWLQAFSALGDHFASTDTTAAGQAAGHAPEFDVLGRPADREHPAPAMSGPQPGEQFISHVSRDWLQQHLPDELQMAVYELPADCADVAVMLRHVWLFAHGRTERFTVGKSTWVIGFGAGKTRGQRAASLRQLLTREVYSGSVKAIVSGAYTDESGTRLQSFQRLEPMLHPGDVLVWEHHDAPDGTVRTGGHTQTISSIDRNPEGRITAIHVLQGNEPVFDEQAQDIQAEEHRPGDAENQRLRHLPGRRVEIGDLSGSRLKDKDGVWGWFDSENTLLIAAGPPGGARRPPARRQHGRVRRSLADWSTAFAAATRTTLPGLFEAALLEARAAIEGGTEPVTPELAAALGRQAGSALKRLKGHGGDVAELRSTLLDALHSIASHPSAPGQPEKLTQIFEPVEAALASASSLNDR
jgi:hypothetical protein